MTQVNNKSSREKKIILNIYKTKLLIGKKNIREKDMQKYSLKNKING